MGDQFIILPRRADVLSFMAFFVPINIPVNVPLKVHSMGVVVTCLQKFCIHLNKQNLQMNQVGNQIPLESIKLQ